LHFAPTAEAVAALRAEGVPADRITLSGNTVIDALLASVGRPHVFHEPVLASLASAGRVILVTMHRRESIGAPMRGACEAVRDIVADYPDVTVVLPVHRNPAVREIVLSVLGGLPRVVLVDPLSYLDFVHLMARSHLILTDSGGVQEEAPSLKRPVLVLREVTERPEGVAAGVAKLVGTESSRIRAAVDELLRRPEAYAAMVGPANPYGDGQAARRIVEAITVWGKSLGN